MKKHSALLFVLIITICLTVSGTIVAVEGDVSGDGACTVRDALIILRAMLNDGMTAQMDLTGDGRVSLVDVLRCLKLATARDPITEPTFVVANVNAAAGDTVTVPITIVKNPGILGMTLKVQYDATALTLTDSANGDALEMLSFTKPKNYKSGCIFTWYGEVLEASDIVDGGVLTLTFTVSETASGSYPITLTYTDGDIFDADLNPVEIAVQNGSLKIAE